MIRVTQGSELEGTANDTTDRERGLGKGGSETRSVNDAVRGWRVKMTRVVMGDILL